jgi:hypothetical protein
LRKYRFAIEAIAARYACLQQAKPVFDSDKRHGIENRKDQFNMASSVITSIASSVKAK